MRWLTMVLVFFELGCGDGVSIRSSELGTSGDSPREFKFCVTQMNWRSIAGSESKRENALDELAVKFGTLNLGGQNATKQVHWGSVDLPLGHIYSQLRMTVMVDSENCDSLNGNLVSFVNSSQDLKTTEQMTFTFTFDPPVEFLGGEDIVLNMKTITEAISKASDGENVRSKAESVVGTATRVE